MDGLQIEIGNPSMAIGLGQDENTGRKFVYLTRQIDGGDDLRPGKSFRIFFKDKEHASVLRTALGELLRIWDFTDAQIAEEMIQPKEKFDYVRAQEELEKAATGG